MSTSAQTAAEKIAQTVLSHIDKKNYASDLKSLITILEKEYQSVSHRGTVTTATALDSDTRKKIESILTKKLDEEVSLDTIVDPSILGGMIITFKDMVIDQSLAHELQTLQETTHESR